MLLKLKRAARKTHDHLAYEGMLTVESLSAESRECLKSLRQQTYSVTELETYAKCPFQYFVNNVLKFRVEEDETEDELSSLERGSLLHKVLFIFYYNRREQEDPPLGQCNDADFKEAIQQLDEILENASEERRGQRKETPIGENNLFWKTDVAKLRVALRKWLEAERTYDVPVLPRYFEVGFGPEGKPRNPELRRDPELSCTTSISIGDVQMTGKIDRIDIGNGAFNIIDYKTGSSTIRMPEILSGRSLQLPIYLQIAKKLLDDYGITVLESASGLYHKVRLDQCDVELGIGTKFQNGIAYKGFKGKDWKKFSSSGQLLDDELFDDRLVRVSGYVQQYVDSISKGNFPLITRVETFVDSEEEGDAPITPKDRTGPCSYCDYKRVCRVGAISETSQSDD